MVPDGGGEGGMLPLGGGGQPLGGGGGVNVPVGVKLGRWSRGRGEPFGVKLGTGFGFLSSI